MKAIDKMAVLPSAHVAGWQHALVTGLPYAGKAGLRLDHPDGLQDDRM
jgi:maltooligosyltrehalose synthase